MQPRLQGPALLLAMLCLCLGVAGCTPAASLTLGSGPTASPVVGAHNDTTTPFNLVSLPALIHHAYDGGDLRLTRVLARQPAYTEYAIGYRSGGRTVTGVLAVPNRPGTFPVLVLAHGYLSPGRYHSGAGLVRERSYLASSGFVVLHTDYRNYAGSGTESGGYVARPLGYPEDVINAARALRRAHLPFVDATRIGVFGRSMGGGVALNAIAARPGVFDAAVLYSPVSSLASDNFDRWVRPDPALRRRVVAAYGTPRDNPGFWRRAGSRGYLGRVRVPVQIHHGLADGSCPPAWSEATAAALEHEGKDVSLYEYPGEPHRFDAAWPVLMRRTVAFFRAHLR